MLIALDSSSTAVADRIAFAGKLAETLSATRQREVLEGWIARAETGIVKRADLGASLFGRNLQFVILVEVLDDGTDFRHVIEGREIIRWFGKTGAERFSALYAPDHFARLRSLYLTVQLTGRPTISTFSVRSVEEEELTFSQLVLPATDDEGIVRFLAIVHDFPDSLRRIPNAPLKIFAPLQRLRRGTAQDTIAGDFKWR